MCAFLFFFFVYNVGLGFLIVRYVIILESFDGVCALGCFFDILLGVKVLLQASSNQLFNRQEIRLRIASVMVETLKD